MASIYAVTWNFSAFSNKRIILYKFLQIRLLRKSNVYFVVMFANSKYIVEEESWTILLLLCLREHSAERH